MKGEGEGGTWVVPNGLQHIRGVQPVADLGHENEVVRVRGRVRVRVAGVAVVDHVVQIQALGQVAAVALDEGGRTVQCHQQPVGVVAAGLAGGADDGGWYTYVGLQGQPQRRESRGEAAMGRKLGTDPTEPSSSLPAQPGRRPRETPQCNPRGGTS